MIEQLNLKKVINIPVINENRRYWLIRTDSGNLWDQFISGSFISIGWNEISDINELKLARENKDEEVKLKRKIENLFGIEQGGRPLGQINRFVFELNIGDIVMFPSANSSIISFCEITSDCYMYNLTTEDIDNELCDHIKRRKIKWLKNVYRKDLDPLLFKMFQAHQTVNNADDYAHVVDRTLEPMFIKENKIHLIVRVNTRDDIGDNLFVLQKLIYDSELEIDNSMKMKINVQSPGFIEFINENLLDMISALIAISGIIGGGKIFGIEVPGLLSWIHKFKESKRQHSIEERKLKLEEDKFNYEKEKEIFEKLETNFGPQLKSLDLETPNQILSNFIKVSKSINSPNSEFALDSISNDDSNKSNN